MTHILCPGCDNVITVTDFPCPSCGRCPGCGRKPKSKETDCPSCGHPQDEKISAWLLTKFGIADEYVDQADTRVKKLRKLQIVNSAVLIVTILPTAMFFQGMVRDHGIRGFLMLTAAILVMVYLPIQVVFVLLYHRQKKLIRGVDRRKQAQ